jgi:uncharacterized membrane protein (UPF0127 family)
MRRLHMSAILATLVLASACTAEPATQSGTQAATVSMTIGKSEFKLEIAADDPTREKGLMNRDSMPGDHGMIFIFAKADRYSFWMKNTRIPLDLLYVDASGKIVDITTLKPFDETGYTPAGAAMYVIELNAGVAKTLKLKTGDALTLPEKLPAGK